jgi:ATPase, YjeE family
MNNQIYDISSLHQLSECARQLLTLSDNRIFALYGDMGAGKTTLVKYFCHHLKIDDEVTSPTFPIVNEYGNTISEKVFHFDFYRLSTLEEVEKIGFEMYLNSGKYCFIEWPKIIQYLLPENCFCIEIKTYNNRRELVIAGNISNL